MAAVVTFRNPATGTLWRASGANIALLASWGWEQLDPGPLPPLPDPFPQYLLPAEVWDEGGKLPEGRLPGRLSDAALRAAFGLKAARVGVLGDSITYNGGGGGNTADARILGRSFFGWSNVALGHTFNWTAADGIPGTAIIGADFPGRLDAMLAQPVDIVVLQLGTNDVGGGASFAAITAAFSAAFSQAVAAGKRVCVLTVPPRGGLTAGQQTVWGQVNGWLRQQGQDVPGVVVADVAAYLCDPAGVAAYLPAYDVGDGVHPNVSGAQQMGRAIAAALRPWAAGPFVLPAPGGPENLISTAAQAWTGGDAAMPSAWWGGANAPTFAQVVRDDGIPGVWQEITVAPGSSTTLTTGVTGWAIGDVIRVYAEVETENPEPLRSVAGEQRFSLRVDVYDTPSYAILGYTGDVYTYSGTEPHQPLAAGIFLSAPFTIPAGADEITYILEIAGGATYRLGRVGVFKVT